MTNDEREAELGKVALRLFRARQELALNENRIRNAATTIARVGATVLKALEDGETTDLLGLEQPDLLDSEQSVRTLFDALRARDELRREIARLEGILGTR